MSGKPSIPAILLLAYSLIAGVGFADADRRVATTLVIDASLHPNTNPNDPAVPYEVRFGVSWRQVDDDGDTVLNGPGVVNSWVIDMGDGTQIVDPDVSRTRYTFVEHTYTTPGPKYITVIPEYEANGLELVVIGGRVCIGPPTQFDPGFEVTPRQGSLQTVVTAKVKQFPPDVFDEELQVEFAKEDSPSEFLQLNTNGVLSASRSLNETGMYAFKWKNSTRACWASDKVYLFPQPVYNVNIVKDASVLPKLEAIHPLNNINTKGMEWNSRITDDGAFLYYISTWDGAPKVFVATKTSGVPGDYSNPIPFFAPPSGLTLRGFEMNSDASTFLFDMVSPTLGTQLGMIQGLGQDAFRLIELNRQEDYEQLWTGPEIRPSLNCFGMDSSGGRLFMHAYYGVAASSTPLSVYDRSSSNQYIYVQNYVDRFKVDELRRLSSNNGKVRFWHAFEGRVTQEFNTIYATRSAIAGESIYSQYTDEEVIARFRWISIADNEFTFARLDQLSRDGKKLFFTSTRPEGMGSLDIFRADLTLTPTNNH